MLTEALEGREEEGKEEGRGRFRQGRARSPPVRLSDNVLLLSLSLSLSLVRLDGFWSPDDDPSEISRKGEI